MNRSNFFNSGLGLSLLAAIGLIWGSLSASNDQEAQVVEIPGLRGAVYEPIEWSGDPKFRVTSDEKSYLT